MSRFYCGGIICTNNYGLASIALRYREQFNFQLVVLITRADLCGDFHSRVMALARAHPPRPAARRVRAWE